jgi:hypothetical protein
MVGYSAKTDWVPAVRLVFNFAQGHRRRCTLPQFADTFMDGITKLLRISPTENLAAGSTALSAISAHMF